MTEPYYYAHAVAYADATASLYPEEALRRFVLALGDAPRHVLDAGCGSGRDAHWFAARGYSVDAFDACDALCAEAYRRFGVAARVASILDLEDVAVADGVWASASLVHMPWEDAREALRRLARALKPGGVLYASVKEGEGRAVDGMGRTFHYWAADAFQAAVLGAADDLERLDHWTNRPTLDVKGQGFVNVLVRRR